MKTSSTSESVAADSNRGDALPLLLSLTTPMVLGMLILGKIMNRQLQEVGKASEEVFRGDRLPILDFPEPPQAD